MRIPRFLSPSTALLHKNASLGSTYLSLLYGVSDINHKFKIFIILTSITLWTAFTQQNNFNVMYIIVCTYIRGKSFFTLLFL